MDWKAPHMITEVLVHDQLSKVVHRHAFKEGEDTANAKFAVPEGVEFLVAYEVGRALIFPYHLHVSQGLTALLPA